MGELRDAFEVSVAASSLTDVDRALVEAGRKLADKIDKARGAEAAKALYLMPHLVSILRELHLTPAARVKLPKTSEAPVDPIDELRAARKRRRSA